VNQLLPLALSGPHPGSVVRSVHDGDTMRVDIFVGSLMIAAETYDVIARNRPVRLLGCNAWELGTEAGAAAQANLRALLPPGTVITLLDVVGYKYGSDGEVVASILLPDGSDLTTKLVAQQWAAPYTGAGKTSDHVPPWPRTVP
jgi:endonuclease YncB( thermonuclease family)